MQFFFDKKTSLYSLVLDHAKQMDAPSLEACSFHFPDTAAHRIAKALDEGVFSSFTLYTELRHRNNKSWQSALKNRGAVLHPIPIHAKTAILQDDKETVVFLSSNNWISDHVFEFSAVFTGSEAVELAGVIRQALPE